MNVLKGAEALEISDTLFAGLVDLAMGLEAVDLDDLLSRVRDPNLRDAFLAAAEFKKGMEPVLERRRSMH